MIRNGDAAKEGLYKVRLVKGGPWVPAKISNEQPRDPDTDEVMDRSFRFVPYIRGVRITGEDQIETLSRISIFGEAVESWEYEYMIAKAAWADTYDEKSPEANPRQRVRLDQMPSLF